MCRRPPESIAFIGMVCLLAAGLAKSAAAEEGTEEANQPTPTTAGFFFCKYKPNYIVLGVAEKDEDLPTTKFQFSFRYVLWDFRAPIDPATGRRPPQPENRCQHPVSRHVANFGYAQKSIWRLYEQSAPFEENNYNPEIYYGYHIGDRFSLGPLDWLTMGVDHESNGEGGSRSRSWNRVYWQLRLTWEDVFRSAPGGAHIGPGDFRQGWEARVYFKFWAIFGEDENTDYGRNLGHLRLIAELSTPDYRWGSAAIDFEGGIGDRGDRGQLQIGLSYRPPIRGRWRFVPYAYAQYFGGYGETLIRADSLTHAFRIGLRLVR